MDFKKEPRTGWLYRRGSEKEREEKKGRHFGRMKDRGKKELIRIERI